MPSIRALSLVALLAGSAAAEAPVVSDEVPYQGAHELRLREMWTVTGDDVLIGQVSAAEFDADGTLYVLDSQLAQVHVISPDGEWLRSVGREGEGPGEFRQPSDMFLLGDGRIGVVQQQPSKIALVSTDGTALDDFQLPDATDGMRLLLRGRAHPDAIVLATSQWTPRDDGSMGMRTFLEAVSRDGNSLGRLVGVDGGLDFASMTMPETSLDNVTMYWDITTDGRVAAVTEFDTYRIDVLEFDGTLVHSIRRDVPPRKRSQAEIDAVKERYDMNINGQDVEILTEENARMVDGIVRRDDGAFWAVLREDAATEEAAGRVLRLDEFDRDGRYRRAYTVRGDVDPEQRRLLVRGDFLIRLQEDEEAGDLSLTCFALEGIAGR